MKLAYQAMGRKMFQIYSENGAIVGQFNSTHYSERGAEEFVQNILAAVNGREETKKILHGYFKIHDILSDIIEEGALTEDMTDEYQMLVGTLEACAILGTSPRIRDLSREPIEKTV